MTIKDLKWELISRSSKNNGYSCIYKAYDDRKFLKGQVILDEEINRQFTVPYDFTLESGQEFTINFH